MKTFELLTGRRHRFRFNCRFLGSEPVSPALPRSQTAVAPKPDPVPPPFQGRVLVVDDDPVILLTTKRKLQSHGFAVMTAQDASQAITAVRRHRPDVIVLDISFPPDVAAGGTVGWDGFSIMGWFRRLPETRTIPIVLISGGIESNSFRDRALAVGALAFLPKPIDHLRLVELIRTGPPPESHRGFPSVRTDHGIEGDYQI